ncbi:GntR family transcriptional regulator [Chelativorans sp.]|uniref:GntR family transcriptional regulator n=1 Tax=Chelativorans sp. TaxID=2203393 RepID=UPI002811AA9F|nr:GntR family transcriptional regulator [Chelativorans sp.]
MAEATPASEPKARSFEPVAAKAYRMLEKMIVTLQLPPGATTTEGALIESLGLGRTPVREAIQRLAWEGLVEVRPRSGLAIAPLTRGDWVKVIDARLGVEVLLARSAARYAAGPMVAQFRNAALHMEKAVLSADAMAFLDADKLLDEALAETADNPYAARLAAPLQTHSRRFWFRYRGESDLARAAEQHVRLIRAILDRDEDGAGREAEALMRLLRRDAESIARP